MKLAPAGGRWAVSGQPRRDWGAGMAGTILVHAVAIGPLLVLATAPEMPTPPAEIGIEMVFVASPAPAADIALPEPQAPPEVQSAELAPPPAEIALPEPQAPPEVQSAELLPEPRPPAPERQVTQALPLPPPAAPPPPRPPQQRAMAAPRPTAPVQVPAPMTAPPPAAAAPSQPSAELAFAWRRALAAWLAAHKSYPEAARRRGVEGTVAIRFSVNPSGHVTGVAVLRGSGSPILDAAAEALLRDADLPPPPSPEQAASISVQIHYTLAD